MLRSARAVVALAMLLFGLGTASPAGANFVAGGDDAAGDAAHPHPGRDIVAVGLSYDRRTGHLRGGVRLRGTPAADAPANLTLFAGYRTATGCNGLPAIGFGSQTDMTRADWIRLDAPDGQPGARGRAQKLYDEAVEEYEVMADALAGQRLDCVIAQVNEPSNPAVVYDTAGPYELRGRPELEARLGKLPSAMRPGRTRTIRVTLRNRGDASTGPVRLAASRARGMTVGVRRAQPALPAGARRSVALKVTLTRGARTATTLRVTATAADGLRARDDGRLYLSKPAPPDGSDRGGSKLCYRYTWQPPFSELVVC